MVFFLGGWSKIFQICHSPGVGSQRGENKNKTKTCGERCSRLEGRWWFQIIFIFTPIWGRFPIWRAYFSDGLVQPPTRYPGKYHQNCGCSMAMLLSGRFFTPGSQFWEKQQGSRGMEELYFHSPGSPTTVSMVVEMVAYKPPEGKDYKWYISGIYCQLGDGLCHRSHLLGEPIQQPLTLLFFKVGGFKSFTIFYSKGLSSSNRVSCSEASLLRLAS